jgi:nodulation protein E
LTDAGLAPAEIDYINGHGVGTRANDLAEMKALAQLFGREPPPCSSIKAVTGHAMGASGALEAVASVLSLRKQMAPPTGAFDEPEPGCALDLIAEGPRAMSIRTVLSNSFAFGGLNASLLFGAV